MSVADKQERSPLDFVGDMPDAPRGWEAMAVVQPPQIPGPGERWPLTFYRVVTVADVNRALGWR